jgi:glycosyltransferase involved in cell wall biosynthesis
LGKESPFALAAAILNNTMKILNISPAIPLLWNFGGAVVTSFKMAKALLQMGHQVFYLTTDARRQSSHRLPTSVDTTWEGLPVRVCKMWGPKPPFYSPELRTRVRLYAPDYDIALIRSCWTYVGLTAGRECRRARLPYLAYPEGSLNPWALRQGRWKKAIWWRLGERAYFQGAAAIVAITEDERKHIRATGLTNRIEVIPNGINLRDLEPAASREELEGKWSPLKGKRWLLYLGRLHRLKGLDLLLQAFARISRKFPEHVLVIAGPDEGNYQEVLHKLGRDLGLSTQVFFPGPVYGEAKAGLLKESELVALTSYSDVFGLSVHEALGCGTPVLVTTNCDIPHVAEAGAGLVVPPDVDSVSRGLEELLRDDGLRREMGVNGRRLVASRFTWERVAQQTVALCEEVIGRGAK